MESYDQFVPIAELHRISSGLLSGQNRRTSKEYRTFTEQQRRLLRKSTSTNLFRTILFEMNNWQNSHLSPQPIIRRVVIRPGNYN